MFSQKSKCYFCTIYHLDYCKKYHLLVLSF
uniref:Uncharacterized protein n=1 Tax=Anguilla anguilla TaxID=7936 RepID=A0A0E9XQE4_ANGAN